MSYRSLSELAGQNGLFTDGDWVESKDQDPDGEIRLLQLADVADGYFKDKSSRYLNTETAKRLRCTFLQENDILIARMPDPIGRSCLFPAIEQKCATVVDVSVLRVDRSLADPNYVSRMINTVEFRKKIDQHVKGSTRTRISRGNLGSLKIPLPPLEEQKRIAGILDQADALRRLRARALEKLNTLGQAVFQEMFGADSDITKRAIDELGSVQGGLQVTASRERLPRKENYLRVANVYRDRLELDEIKTIGLTDAEFERTKLKNGDILIVEGHGNPNEIGRTAVWQGEVDDCVHQNHLIRFRPDANIVLPQYVSSYLNSKVGRQVLISTSRTTSGLNTISTAKVKAAKIPVPSLQDQKIFVQRCEGIEAELIVARRAHEKQEALFASLQSAAFQGKL